MDKYGKIVAERKEFGKNEPLFLLRGQDALAPGAIEAYASLVRAAASSPMSPVEKLHALADECEVVAASMRAWQAGNPELVRLPD